jgi:predicted extracellular nuclease
MPRLRVLLLSLATAALLIPCAALAATELLISEYIEGSSNNKALEIYNPTAAAVDLSTYSVQIYFNGSGTPLNTIVLASVSLASGDVWVLANSSASFAGTADQTSGSLTFNGDDAVVLLNGATVVDVIGQVGFDPGTEWGTGLVSTQDNTLRRNADVCAGDTNPNDVFDPSLEWTGYATDTFDGLGAHTSGCLASVPGASGWGLAAMGGLMLAGAALVLRRRTSVAA